MPIGDGTGPAGMGPGTGHGRGWCRAGFRFADVGRTAFRGRNRWLLGIAAPVIIAAIRDVANPKGLLRQFGSALLGERRTEDKRHVRQNAEYTISDSNTKTMPQDTDSNGKGKAS